MKRNDAIGVFLTAFAVFLLYSIPGIRNPELLLRPDSGSYLEPAKSILSTFTYGTALRVPLYPLYLAFSLFAGWKSLSFCVVMNDLAAALTPMLVYLTIRAEGGKRIIGFAGAGLFVLCPTALALAPMFLSDTLFTVFTAAEGYFMVRYLNSKKTEDFYLCALLGGLGCLVRPLNLLWIFPCLAIALFARAWNWKNFILACAIFLIPPGFWVLRNLSFGSGWRIDAVSADSLKHNAAVVESKVYHYPAEHFRRQYSDYFKTSGIHGTDDDSLTAQEKYLSSRILKHKWTYLKSFYNPVLFVPDVPSFLENLGLSVSGRGTWDIIVKDGFFAGVKHYFSGKYGMLFLVFPLCAVTLAVYLLAALRLFQSGWRDRFLFCGLSLYYITVTGAVAYPRFMLPALPFLCVLAALQIQKIVRLNKE